MPITGRAGRLCLQAGWLSACPAGAGDAGKGQAATCLLLTCAAALAQKVCVCQQSLHRAPKAELPP